MKSIRQRVLLNAWLRVLHKDRPLPLLSDFQLEGASDEPADMMSYDVLGNGGDARFLITQAGARLAATYGNEQMDPAERTNRFLDDAIGPKRYARIRPSYRACLKHRRPTYTVSRVRDADGKDVSFERLLLPFGSDAAVDQIIGSYKAISIEGGFKLTNLMGVQPNTVPVDIISAIIDHGAAPSPTDRRAAADVIEMD